MAERAGWPEMLELDLHGFAQGGYAVGRWQGRPVFARGGLPGERVLVRLSERAQSLARGDVVEVLSASPARIASPGVESQDCIGCDWQHIAYEAQLAGKAHILRDQLVYLGRVADPDIRTPIPSEPWGYRTTARLHVAGAQIGFYAPGTRRLVPIDQSPLLHPLLNNAISTLQPLLPIPDLREVTLRASLADQTVMGLFHGGDRQILKERAGRWHAALPALSGTAVTTRKGWALLSGEAYLYEQMGSLRLRLSPVSFFQANVPLAQAMLDAVREALALQAGDRLLDAYCGAGTFILPLARSSPLAGAVGIEENPFAVEDARASAVEAGIDGVRIIAGRVEDVLPELMKVERFTAALLDPPRRGMEPAALQALIAHRPTRIAYISCHPGTLARDIRALVEAGYRLRFAQPFDFFPQTSHVETLSLLDWSGG